jgi:hypothetical protein
MVLGVDVGYYQKHIKKKQNVLVIREFLFKTLEFKICLGIRASDLGCII